MGPIMFALLLVSGQGCTKGPTAEQQAAVRPVTLNYWTVYDDVDQLRRLAAEYTAQRPYVTINIRQVRYEEFDRLFVNALADDVAPDIVSTHIRWLDKYRNRLAPMPPSIQVANTYVKGEYVQETVVENLNFTMPSPAAVRSNFVSTVYDDVVRDGQVYGLPLSLDTLAIYYNPELLDKAGVPLPPSTWNEFEQAVQKSTTFDAAGNIVQSGAALGTADNVNNMFDIMSMLIMQSMAGENLTIAEGNRVTFANGLRELEYEHPVLQALRFYTGFAEPTTEDYSWNEDKVNSLDAFARGELVFYFGFAHDRATIEARAPQLDFEVIPVPQLNSQAPVNIANYWMQSVVAKSDNRNIAWDFIRFITTPDKIERYVNANKLPTPLRAQIDEQLADEEIFPFASQVLVAKNWYRGNDVDTAENAFSNMITSFLQTPGEEDGRDAFRRDADIVSRAAQVIQQTY